MDSTRRMRAVAASSAQTFFDFFCRAADSSDESEIGEEAERDCDVRQLLGEVPAFQSAVAGRATDLLLALQREYLTGRRGGAPASVHLNRTRAPYEFVRLTLGVGMFGVENLDRFEEGFGVKEETIGQYISRIHEVSDCIAVPFIIVEIYWCLSRSPLGYSRWKTTERRCQAL